MYVVAGWGKGGGGVVGEAGPAAGGPGGAPPRANRLPVGGPTWVGARGDPLLCPRRHGFGPRQVRGFLAVCELARRWNVPVDASAPVVSTPREALLQFQPLRASQRECFAVLYLNSRNQPVGYEQVAVGGLNVAAIQPREVFAPALQLAAAAVVVAHNHPSGDPTPSPEDLAVTRHLQEAGRLLGVEVLDHLVISADRFRSLREAGYL